MSHRLHTVAVLVLALALTSAPVLAATAPSVAAPATRAPVGQVGPTDRADVEAWLDETMADQLARYRVPGAAVVVVADGEVLLARGYGYADLAAGRRVVADETVFSVGSTGKLVTWTGVMQGVEDGRLDLDRDVNDYLAESTVAVPATYPEPVTLAHLGTHSAGFEDTFAGMLADDPDEVRPLEQLLAEHRPARVRPPGEFVAYSNYGTALAGHVLAERYDTTFVAYADERIFTPLGMADTTYAQPLPARLESRRAVGYTHENGEYRPHPPQVWTMPPEGGSLRTTATDMGRFMVAHLNDGASGSARVLDADTVREMHGRQFTKAPSVPELNGMAYGFIEMDRNGERIVGHWGDTAHFRSLLALVPERDAGLFVVYNSPGGHAARTALLDSFVDRYFPRSGTTVPTPSPGATARAAALTGDYRSLTVSESSWVRAVGVATRTYTVASTGDGDLTTRRLGEAPRRWVERRPGVYRDPEGGELLVFRFDEAGRATHLFFGGFGPATYERVPSTESLAVVQGVLAAGVVAFLSTLLVWVGAAAWRRRRGVAAPSDDERATRWLLGTTCLLWLVVLAVFVAASIDLNAEVASPSLALRAGMVLRWVALAGTVGAVAATLLAWRGAYWSLPARLHYTGVALAAVLFAWQLSLLGILPL